MFDVELNTLQEQLSDGKSSISSDEQPSIDKSRREKALLSNSPYGIPHIGRIIARDTRADMSVGFLKAMNAGYNAVEKFTRKHCHPNCKLIDGVKTNLGVDSRKVVVVGLQNMSSTLVRGHDDIPDLVGILYRTQIFTARDGSSKVLFFVRIQGTQMAQCASSPSDVVMLRQLDLVATVLFKLDPQCNIVRIVSRATPVSNLVTNAAT